MTHRKNVTMIDADLPMDSVLQQVLSSPIHVTPVWKGNRENIVGILHKRSSSGHSKSPRKGTGY